MASLHLDVQEQFDFHSPDDLPRWKKRFEQFRLATGLASESEARQISTLLYCLGEDSQDVLGSTNITSEERKSYSTVLEKSDGHFQVQHSKIFERARFNKHDQPCGESTDQYITILYQMAERCEYENFTSEMIQDRLVFGISDSALSEKLQIDSALTLDKAKRLIRQQEAVCKQQDVLKKPSKDTGTTSEHIVDYVKYRTSGGQTGNGHKSRTQMNKNVNYQSKCTRCGKAKLPRDKWSSS